MRWKIRCPLPVTRAQHLENKYGHRFGIKPPNPGSPEAIPLSGWPNSGGAYGWCSLTDGVMRQFCLYPTLQPIIDGFNQSGNDYQDKGLPKRTVICPITDKRKDQIRNEFKR